MYLLHALVVLVACMDRTLGGAIAARDPTPAASTTYPIPSVLTPARATIPQFSQSPLMHSTYTVASRADYGKMVDPSNTYTLFRDAGGSCAIANRTLWFSCDTLAYRTWDGKYMGAASNSISLATNFSEPNILKDASCTPATGIRPAMPWTSAEAVVAGSPSNREDP